MFCLIRVSLFTWGLGPHWTVEHCDLLWGLWATQYQLDLWRGWKLRSAMWGVNDVDVLEPQKRFWTPRLRGLPWMAVLHGSHMSLLGEISTASTGRGHLEIPAMETFWTLSHEPLPLADYNLSPLL